MWTRDQADDRPRILTEEERRLLALFNNLDEEGRALLIDNAAFLARRHSRVRVVKR